MQTDDISRADTQVAKGRYGAPDKCASIVACDVVVLVGGIDQDLLVVSRRALVAQGLLSQSEVLTGLSPG